MGENRRKNEEENLQAFIRRSLPVNTLTSAGPILIQHALFELSLRRSSLLVPEFIFLYYSQLKTKNPVFFGKIYKIGNFQVPLLLTCIRIDIKVANSIKYGWNINVLEEIIHMKHFVQSFLHIKVYTSEKNPTSATFLELKLFVDDSDIK